MHQRFSTEAWDDRSDLFTAGVLQQLRDANGPGCNACINASLVMGGHIFEEWAEDVKQVLKEQLEKLEFCIHCRHCLYSTIWCSMYRELL